jgi:hypothetical protein
MPRARLLAVATLFLAACGGERPASEPAEPAEAPAPADGASARPAAERPFAPPADAKVLPLGEPRMVPQELQGKSHAPPQSDPRVTCRSSRDSLTRRFGPEQIEDREVDVGEGTTAPGTVVAAGTPMAQEVVWADQARTRPERIRVLGEGIRDPGGLGLGTSLADLEKTLGPFELYGFGWDRGGTVQLEGTRLARLQGKLFFQLEPGVTDTPEAKAALGEVVGQDLFPSSDPRVLALEPEVSEFMMVCPQQPKQD